MDRSTYVYKQMQRLRAEGYDDFAIILILDLSFKDENELHSWESQFKKPDTTGNGSVDL